MTAAECEQPTEQENISRNNIQPAKVCGKSYLDIHKEKLKNRPPRPATARLIGKVKKEVKPVSLDRQ
jgi:hypothetical protein